MKIVLTLFIATCLACSHARASFELVWSPTSGSSIGGSPIAVDLVLKETGTTYINDFGLVGASFTVTNSGGFGTIASASGNPAFGVLTVLGPDPVFTIDQSEPFGIGTGSGAEIIVGSFVINPVTNGIGTLTVSAFGSGDDFVVFETAGFTPLTIDSQVFNNPPTFNYEVTAVPEPTSMALVGVAALGGLAVRYRGWRRASKTISV